MKLFKKISKKREVINHKVPASTLIEVIVAMVILVTIAGITLVIFLNVFKTNNAQLRLKAFADSEAIIANQISGSEYFETNNPSFIYNSEQKEFDGIMVNVITIKNKENMLLFSKIICLPPQ